MFLENKSATEDAAVIGGLSWKWWFSCSIIQKPNNRFVFFIDLHQQLRFLFFLIVSHHQVGFNVCHSMCATLSRAQHKLLDISDILHIRRVSCISVHVLTICDIWWREVVVDKNGGVFGNTEVNNIGSGLEGSHCLLVGYLLQTGGIHLDTRAIIQCINNIQAATPEVTAAKNFYPLQWTTLEFHMMISTNLPQ